MRIVTWQMAEEMAQGHMHAVGFRDARRTNSGADGGIDVTSARAVAQVKHHATPVGSPAVQQLKGTAYGHDHALFYAGSGYTVGAVQFAAASGVALFQYDDDDGDVTPVNETAAFLGTTDLTEPELERAASWMGLPRVWLTLGVGGFLGRMCG